MPKRQKKEIMKKRGDEGETTTILLRQESQNSHSLEI
jgi:hypothetical protein